MANSDAGGAFSGKQSEKKGFFSSSGGKKDAGQQREVAAQRSALQNDVSTLNTRLRIAEERYNDLRRQLQFVEQNMISQNKKLINENKTLRSQLTDLKRQLKAVEERVVTVIKELQLTARKEDVDVMKRYVEMWNPVRFVSREQVSKIIDQKISDHHQEMHEED